MVQERGLNLWPLKGFLAPTPSVRQPLFETSDLKGAFAKGCFLAFEVLQWEAPFVLSRFSGAFVLSPVQELLTQTPRRRKVLKAPSGKSTL